ncbi:Lrp/AsnC ligand binding domain-containing protein [Pseudoroseomonas globiformis]|uniref:Lrp/AsnC ligand binding domain-containing protein n=1 Tax=Teichococcus globiformis TaxID=2307229 RepID=A0ABV7FZR2_9PROT
MEARPAASRVRRLTVFVGIKVERHRDEAAEAFRKSVRAMPEVVSCHLVSGEADFLLQVVVPDLAAYERLLLRTLLKMPRVTDIRSNFAIQTVKEQAPFHSIIYRERRLRRTAKGQKPPTHFTSPWRKVQETRFPAGVQGRRPCVHGSRIRLRNMNLV